MSEQTFLSAIVSGHIWLSMSISSRFVLLNWKCSLICMYSGLFCTFWWFHFTCFLYILSSALVCLYIGMYEKSYAWLVWNQDRFLDRFNSIIHIMCISLPNRCVSWGKSSSYLQFLNIVQQHVHHYCLIVVTWGY